MTSFGIVFRSGPLAGKEENINSGEVIIGRDPKCQISIDDLQISRNHLKIYSKDPEIFLEDLNSTNGSFINGIRVKKATQLKQGDLVSLGENHVFEITFIEPDDNAKKPDDESSIKENNIIFYDEGQAGGEKTVTEAPQKRTGKKMRTVSGKFLTSLPTWALILFIAIAFFIAFCLIPFVIIEVTNQWCNLFSGFFNSISPGVCP